MIMKKLTIIIMILASILACNKNEEYEDNRGINLQGECFNIKISCDVKVNLDCPEKSSYFVNITQCEEHENPKFCHYTAELYFENQLVETKLSNGISVFGHFQEISMLSNLASTGFQLPQDKQDLKLKCIKSAIKTLFMNRKHL